MSTDEHGSNTRGSHPDDARSGSDDARSGWLSNLPGPLGIERWLRAGSIVGVVAVMGAYLSVLYHVVDITGAVLELFVIVAAAVGLGTLLARRGLVEAALLVAVLSSLGLAAYLAAVPPEARGLLTPTRMLSDTVALLSGLSVLRLISAGSWALAITPAPTFLAWYLAMRGRYPAAATVAGGVLGLFVLTGDAGMTMTVVGAVGVTVAVGLGSLTRPIDAGAPVPEPETFRRHVGSQLELLVIVVAAMILLSSTVAPVAGGGVGSAGGDGSSGAGGATTEASLVSTSDELKVSGLLTLSPEVRMLVYSDQSAHWRTATYDRYTGDGWIRTGQASPYEGELDAPPGTTERIDQTVVSRTGLDVMPAANSPTVVEGEQAEQTRVTTQGTVEPAETLTFNESYTVRSEQPVADPDELRNADDYGEGVEQYRQLPESTPDRVHERSAEVAGGEDTAYDKAVAIDSYLKESKEYSLSVEQPEDDIADAFLFEMDAGYCTYFATTMTVMLRSQDVPARVAVGYSPGQQVEQEEGPDAHVVRGYNAHAWVEVYFEDVGWVTFDPTPAAPREEIQQAQLSEAREDGELDVDAVGSAEVTVESPNGTDNITVDGAAESDPESDPDEGMTGIDGAMLPEPRTIGLGLVGLVGAVAIVRRTGTPARARRTGRQYRQPRRSPTADVELAWERVEHALARQYRTRHPGETPRSYVRALAAEQDLDPRVRTVLDRYERARYAGDVNSDDADTAVAAADGLIRKRLTIVGRYLDR